MERVIELTIGTRFGDMHTDLPVSMLPQPYRSAPELLEALRGVMRFALPITHHDVEDYNRARAAIASATGEG